MKKFIPPEDMDIECIYLCTILNDLDGIETYESCCGHLTAPYMVFFRCYNPITLAKLYRSVDRRYSDGNWEILADGSDVHPTFCFWLRSKKCFESYDEMEQSVLRLTGNINYWQEPCYNSYFTNSDDTHKVGWINIYANNKTDGNIYKTRNEALSKADINSDGYICTTIIVFEEKITS